MKLRAILAAPIAVVAAGVLLSACGQASQVSGTAQISPAAAASAVSAAAAPDRNRGCGRGERAGGAGRRGRRASAQVLVGANGHTLYAFTKDVDGPAPASTPVPRRGPR